MSTNQSQSQAAQGLHKISLAMRHHAWQSSTDQGMSPTQSQALVALRTADGPLRLSALAEALSIKPATASETITSLEAKGLISKGPDEDDRRAVALRLTASGLRASDQVTLWPDTMLDAIGALEGDELAVLHRALIKIIYSMQARGAVPISRMCINCAHFKPNAHQESDKPHHCGFIDAPIGDAELRIDCDDVDLTSHDTSARLWQAFVDGKPLDPGVHPAGASP